MVCFSWSVWQFFVYSVSVKGFAGPFIIDTHSGGRGGSIGLIFIEFGGDDYFQGGTLGVRCCGMN